MNDLIERINEDGCKECAKSIRLKMTGLTDETIQGSQSKGDDKCVVQ